MYPDGGTFIDMCASDGSDDKRGIIVGRLRLTDNAFLDVHEVVVVRGKHIHRETYAYFLVIDGIEIGGYERDPLHEPALHKHVRGHKREDADRISFRDAVERAWHAVDPSVGDPGRFFP